jgi:16S rRNA (adenine1518-N6/adenine1519-N6)-dimethyltransferase
MTLFEKTQQRLQELKINPKKSLGQNFLVSDRIVQQIIERVRAVQPLSLIEIGPGLGALTDSLLDLGIPLKLIELDQVFYQFWKSRNVDVMNVDALQWHWKVADPNSTLLVSNLPYQISSRVVVDRTLDDLKLRGMILMFQKEVAQKIRAKIKTEHYGMLGIFTQTFWRVEKVLDAGTVDFFPPPKVASQVLFFEPISSRLDSKKFLKLLKAAFSHPRKILISNLSALTPRENLEPIFKTLGFLEKTRAEQLSIDDFHELYDRLETEWL